MHNDQHNEHLINLNVFILLAIIILAVISMFFVGNSSNRDYNMDNSILNHKELIAKNSWGHRLRNTTSLTIVLSKAPHPFNSYNQESVNQVISNLKSNKHHYGIQRIITPADNLASQSQLTSKDSKVQLIKLDVNNHLPLNKRITQLRHAIKVPNLHEYITGRNVINDTNENDIGHKLPIIELISAILIFISLAIIFKAWILPILTVGSIWISLELSRNIALIINRFINIHTTFINVGYSILTLDLLLILIGCFIAINYWKHFASHISNHHNNSINASHQSLKDIINKTCAVTVCGFLIYLLINPIDSISIILMSIIMCLSIHACSTLTGKGAFWSHFAFHNLNQNITPKHLNKASIISIGIITLIVFGGGYFLRPKILNYNMASNISNQSQAKQGLDLINEHFSRGFAEPSYIYIKSPHKLNNEASMKKIDALTQQIRHNHHVESVSSITEPTGQPINQLYIKNQLSLLTGKSIHSQASLAEINPSLHGSDLGASQLRAIADSAQNIDQHLQAIQSIESHNKMSKAFSNDLLSSSHNTLSPSQRQLLMSTSKQLSYIAKDTANVGNNTKIFGSQLSKLQSEIAQVNSGLIKLNNGFQKSNNYLASLQKSSATNVYYIPNVILRTKYNRPLNEFMSANKHATIIKVSTKGTPSNARNQRTIMHIKHQAKDTFADSSIHVFGTSFSAHQQASKLAISIITLCIGIALLIILMALAYGSLVPISLFIADILLGSVSIVATSYASHYILHQHLNSSAITIIAIILIMISLVYIISMIPRLNYKHHNQLTTIIDARLTNHHISNHAFTLSLLGIGVSCLITQSTAIIQIGILIVIADILYYLFNPYLISGFTRLDTLLNHIRH